MPTPRANKTSTALDIGPREPFTVRAWPFGLFVLLALIFHGRMLISPPSEMIATLDIVYYFRWMHMYTYEEFMAGRLPLWNPYTYCGTPFAANPQATVWYPLSWLYMVVDIFQAQKYMVVLHTMLAGSFMYLFLRELGSGNATQNRANDEERIPLMRRVLFPDLIAGSVVKRELMARPAAVIGAVAYMFGNYMMANTAVGHLTMIFTATWLPLALFCYERALSRGRTIWLMWTGMVLGAQVLAGEPQNSYYSVVALTLYGLVRSIMASAPPDASWFKQIPRRILGWGLGLWIVAIVSAGASFIQLLPTAEFARLSDRSTNNFTFATFMSQEPEGFLEFFIPWANEDYGGIGVKSWNLAHMQNWEFGAYLGMITLALAGASFAVRKSAGLWAFRVLLVFAVVLMLGKFTPLYQHLYEYMPGLNLFRIPARAVVIVHLCLCAMAAMGAQYILKDDRMRWRRPAWLIPSTAGVALVLIGLAILVLGIGMHRVVVPQPGVKEFTDAVMLNEKVVLHPMIGAALAIVAIIAAAFMRRPNAAAALLVMALLVDLFLNNPRVPLDRPGPLDQDTSYKLLAGVARAADESMKPFRVDCPPRQGKVPYLIVNTALAARVEAVNGYSPMSIGRFYRFVHFMRGRSPSNMTRHELPELIYLIDDPFPLRIMNVRFATVWDAQANRHRPVDTNPLPRAWIVDRAEVIADEEQALHRLRDCSFDPATAVILETPPQIAMTSVPDAGPPGFAVCKRLEPGRLEIQTQSSRDGYLVISEVFYPGWKATIDGRPVELERANDLITALPLPAGNHTVIYEYDPMSFKIGAAGTALTWLGAIIIGVIDLGRQRRRSDGSIGR